MPKRWCRWARGYTVARSAVRGAGGFGPVLSTSNQLGEGRALYKDPLDDSSLMARLAVGGVVPVNLPEYLPQVRTGGVVQAGPKIDYDRLADMVAAKLAPAFVKGAKALLPPETNLTALRWQMLQLDKRDAETNT